MAFRAVLRRISDSAILKKNVPYPRTDGGPISELDSDLEWLIVREDPLPVFDSRTHDLIATETATSTPDVAYPHLNQYTITYSTQVKPDSELNEAVKFEEDNANKTFTKARNLLKLAFLGMYVLNEKIEGNTLTANQQAVLDAVLAKASRMWTNDQVRKDKLQDIIDSNPLDLDTNWDKD